MMVQEEACAGRLAGNPLRGGYRGSRGHGGNRFYPQRGAGRAQAHRKGVAGDQVAAHRAGCAFLDKFYLKRIPRRADIVLVSQGGAPKDINLYQTQKALDNAKHAVKEGAWWCSWAPARRGWGKRPLNSG